MPLTRWIISTKNSVSSPAESAIVNTLYFNVSGSVDEPNYQSLGDDLAAIWRARPWCTGRFLDVRGYDMADPEPRPQKYLGRTQTSGTPVSSPHQVALCLSYYADRNLPSSRGRIYTGPWAVGGEYATNAQISGLIGLAGALAGLGGLNVDWSLYSPKTGTATRINHAWVDDSWDIIRSRKLPASSPRVTWDGNG